MKKCTICGIEKHESEFAKNNQQKSGLNPSCKECKNTYDRSRQKTEHVRSINRSATSKYTRGKGKDNCRKWRDKNPKKYKAQTLLGNALRDKKITKPEICSMCGSNNVDHGHHWDHSKPLDVVWCCNQCHQDIHNDCVSEVN